MLYTQTHTNKHSSRLNFNYSILTPNVPLMVTHLPKSTQKNTHQPLKQYLSHYLPFTHTHTNYYTHICWAASVCLHLICLPWCVVQSNNSGNQEYWSLKLPKLQWDYFAAHCKDGIPLELRFQGEWLTLRKGVIVWCNKIQGGTSLVTVKRTCEW